MKFKLEMVMTCTRVEDGFSQFSAAVVCVCWSGKCSLRKGSLGGGRGRRGGGEGEGHANEAGVGKSSRRHKSLYCALIIAL